MALLKCTIFPGQFKSEVAVIVRSASGRDFSLFAETSEVEFEGIPDDNEALDGWITVEVIENAQEKCLVRLPKTTIENGQYLTIFRSQLRESPCKLAEELKHDPVQQ